MMGVIHLNWGLRNRWLLSGDQDGDAVVNTGEQSAWAQRAGDEDEIIPERKTGVSVEDAFWNRLKEIAADRKMTLSDLVTTINSKRTHNNLSSAIRLFVLDHYRRQVVPLLRKRWSAKG
jgi:macrodomain Ter protein organizer (MatP/YcbG family)